ncbi:DUF4236 domain-containing protein [Neobacillus mesonae]|uniref:DUF4236 domain-containing protein n=1 Tax=Neobacillus mesonae TaxID=1193713 RepID=UPI00203F936F|nr:DUF4236 domain-containing protein [Neobacillus mesonae]MCM3567774.1 DUF4236 domain-containing protein [Neobacillus mesonae]
MGFRFRKSIKIAPGIRMNVGKKSVGLSVGVPGLRYTINSSGKRTTSVGIPGSGLYYTTSSGSKSYKTPAYQRRNELAKQQREWQKLQEAEQARLQVELYKNRLEQIRSIHHESDDPINWQEVYHRDPPFRPGEDGPSTIAARQQLEAYQPGVMDKLFNRDDQKRQKLYEEIEKAREQDTSLLKGFSHMHEIAGRMLNRDIDTYLEVIEEFNPLDDLVDFGSSFEFGTDNPNEMHVSFEVNAKSVVPEKSLSLTKTGKLSEKALTKTAYYDIYQDYVCSAALRIARDMLALLPINYVFVSAYEDRLNQATGHRETIAILSVKYDRITINRLNFENLDPSEALANFQHKMNFKKTQGFGGIGEELK